MPSGVTGDSGHKLKPMKFHLNIITVSVAKHWYRLPGELAESPSLEIFRP